MPGPVSGIVVLGRTTFVISGARRRREPGIHDWVGGLQRGIECFTRS